MAKGKTVKSRTVRKKASKREPAKKTKDLAKKEYTEEERKRFAHYYNRCKKEPPRFKILKSDPVHPEIGLEEAADPLTEVKMLEAMGTPDGDLQVYLLDQVVKTISGYATSKGIDTNNVVKYCNNAIAILNGIQPQDEIEGMLAVQMIGVHNMAMETMKRAMLGDQGFERKQVNVNQATKMLRTFVAQMEALKKYRTGGQQKMIVEHVHVNEGGQAIVGTVNQGGRKNDKNSE